MKKQIRIVSAGKGVGERVQQHRNREAQRQRENILRELIVTIAL